MALFSLITIGLSIFYSYTWDFQPQGRYILPVLIPFMYVVTTGVQKLCGLLEKWISRPSGAVLGKLFCAGIMAYVLLAFLYSLFRCVLPYYSHIDGLFSVYQLIL